jgi:mono/diheme cytochrome c family protein
LQRLHVGGEHMLPPVLSEAEIRSLVAYLEQLSGVPGAEKKQIAVKESSYHVGEHIVKSTCHVCHNATGPNPSTQQILEGAIPPLATLTTRVGLPDFVRKVTKGAPIIMGTPPTSYRGRMSVFVYLSQDEAAAAYLYLSRYPPRP